MVAVLALMRWISGSSAICVNLPLAASNSAWYLTLDWFLEFSARRFISGVSATIVAFALGTCLHGRRRVYGALELKDFAYATLTLRSMAACRTPCSFSC